MEKKQRVCEVRNSSFLVSINSVILRINPIGLFFGAGKSCSSARPPWRAVFGCLYAFTVLHWLYSSAKGE
jgi:hypothetical protein